jgi:epoxyqueuosine reductase
MDSLLLQACCAPCVAYPIETLGREFTVGLLYYNPNIHPKEEYDKRLDELVRHASRLNVPLEVGLYDTERWFEAVRGLESEPEQGKRCSVCFTLRLRATAQWAKAKGFTWFGTGLTSSPYKKADTVNTIGQQIEQETGVRFYAADFKKGGGSERSREISRTYGFYRQNYCGCIFSKQERERKTAWRAATATEPKI